MQCFFYIRAHADGHRKATYNLLLRSNNITNTLSVLSFVPRTVSNSHVRISRAFQYQDHEALWIYQVLAYIFQKWIFVGNAVLPMVNQLLLYLIHLCEDSYIKTISLRTNKPLCLAYPIAASKDQRSLYTLSSIQRIKSFMSPNFIVLNEPRRRCSYVNCPESATLQYRLCLVEFKQQNRVLSLNKWQFWSALILRQQQK